MSEEPIVLMDKDAAAVAVEPLVRLLIDQCVKERGLGAVQAMLPLRAKVMLALTWPDGTPVATASCESELAGLNLVQ
jgi:hypothetical protein